MQLIIRTPAAPNMSKPREYLSVAEQVVSRVETSRIPSLDGLRAVSIGMVLLAHSGSSIAILESHPLFF